MSYDYILIKGAPGAGLEMLMLTTMSELIGAVAAVKSKITEAFPAVKGAATNTAAPGLGSEGVFGHSGPPERSTAKRVTLAA